jgi:hypothetical protein
MADATVIDRLRLRAVLLAEGLRIVTFTVSRSPNDRADAPFVEWARCDDDGPRLVWFHDSDLGEDPVRRRLPATSGPRKPVTVPGRMVKPRSSTAISPVPLGQPRGLRSWSTLLLRRLSTRLRRSPDPASARSSNWAYCTCSTRQTTNRHCPTAGGQRRPTSIRGSCSLCLRARRVVCSGDRQRASMGSRSSSGVEPPSSATRPPPQSPSGQALLQLLLGRWNSVNTITRSSVHAPCGPRSLR